MILFYPLMKYLLNVLVWDRKKYQIQFLVQEHSKFCQRYENNCYLASCIVLAQLLDQYSTLCQYFPMVSEVPIVLTCFIQIPLFLYHNDLYFLDYYESKIFHYFQVKLVLQNGLMESKEEERVFLSKYKLFLSLYF